MCPTDVILLLLLQYRRRYSVIYGINGDKDQHKGNRVSNNVHNGALVTDAGSDIINSTVCSILVNGI